MDGIEPEHVIVFETVGTIDEFYKAVRTIQGLEWLVEFEGEALEENDDFHRSEQTEDEIGKLSRRLYLVMSNRQGMTELLSLWRAYCRFGATAQFSRGKAKWKHLFKQLNDMRLWNANDRLLATGLKEDWEERVRLGEESVNVEIELWFKSTPQARSAAQNLVRAAVEEAGGQVVTSSQIEGIHYHALLAMVPIENVEAMFDETNTIRLAQSDQVMFFRPSGQSTIRITHDPQIVLEEHQTPARQPQEQAPLIALIDGVPLENHSWIRNFIQVDDPDGLAREVEARNRVHGTAMASLILNGDGNTEPTFNRPIYVRPVMTARQFGTEVHEFIPEEKLAADVIHECIVRMFRGTGGSPPTCPTVKVVNLSIGEKFRPFVYFMSPLSRLLDWLSFEFNIVFVVSAGNHSPSLTLPLPSAAVEALPVNGRQGHTLRAIVKETMTKRILSPAESINAISVGAANFDGSTFQESNGNISLLESGTIVNSYSSFGLGFRNGIKPDVLAPGGRSLFRSHSSTPTESTFRPVASPNRAPGQRTASPRGAGTSLASFTYSAGTSNAAALVTRLAGKALDSLSTFNAEQNLGAIPEEYWPCLAKALAVHGASWQDAKAIFRDLAPEGIESGRLKNWITRFLGYGMVNEERSLFCDDYSATTVSYGSISDGSAHIFEFPIPNSLSGAATLKRMVVTLAWLTPIDSFNRKYRKAQLWFSKSGKHIEDPLLVQRSEVDWRTARRGTLQHEIFEGSQIGTFVQGEVLKVEVNCKAEAGKLEVPVRYGLAVSIESADQALATIYDEVRESIRARVRVQAT